VNDTNNENNNASAPSRLRGVLRAIGIYFLITVATLALADVVLIATGLFPPIVRPGHAELGWVAARPTGEMRTGSCTEYASGVSYDFQRNEDAMRTSFSAESLAADTMLVSIAVGGDSQTELCAPNDSTHFGFLDRDLRAGGTRAAVFAYGAGKYSPLQAYLALRPSMAKYHADVFVLNLYLGNDVYDMLRVDDRPHFVRSDSGLVVAPPVWYQEDPPGTVRRSRVLWLLRTLADRTGIRNVAVRLRYLRDAADERGASFPDVISYMQSLRRSTAPELGYPAAYSAQMLNQQLFFHHFPGSREESLARVQALLEMVRREQPGALLVLSPLPSYQGILRERVDSSFLRVLERLPITNVSGYEDEERLNTELRALAAATGWLFVDNLTPLRAYSGGEPLFNDHDFHYLPVGSEIIGRSQAEVIAPALRARSPIPPPRRR